MAGRSPKLWPRPRGERTRLETDLTLQLLLTGAPGPHEAVETGRIRIAGSRELLECFVAVFRIPPVPVALPAQAAGEIGMRASEESM